MIKSELRTDIFDESEGNLIKAIQRDFDHSDLQSQDSESVIDDKSPCTSFFSSVVSIYSRDPSTSKPKNDQPLNTFLVSTFIVLIITAGICACIPMITNQMIKTNISSNLGHDQYDNKNISIWKQEQVKLKRKSKLFQKGLSQTNNPHHLTKMLLENLDIPIFLDLPGTSTMVFLDTLSQCLGLKSGNTFAHTNPSHQVISNYHL